MLPPGNFLKLREVHPSSQLERGCDDALRQPSLTWRREPYTRGGGA